jgi:flagellar hook-associated protein 3 FlgL
MRVTESRMIDLVTVGVSRAREQASDAGQKLQTGIKVARPSDDESAWAEGQRAAVRQVVSDKRGSAIGRARDLLTETDGALAGVGGVIAQVTQLAVQFGNDTYGATDRAEGAKVVLALRDAALASANATNGDGEFILAGSKGGAAPFDAAGNYAGDSQSRTIETGDGTRLTATVPGSVLTAAAGVDVFGVLDRVAAALNANDPTTLRSLVSDLRTATAQVAEARSEVGGRINALDSADEMRKNFEAGLASTKAAATETDPIAGASELARATAALDASKTVAQQIISILRS